MKIRTSDVERNEIARRIQEATADGRLTVDEAEERLAAAFAATYRDQLPPLVADLPVPEPPAPRPPRVGRVPVPLVVHAVIVAVWSVLLVGRWASMDAEFFWPVFPMFWMWLTVAVHAAVRLRRGQLRLR